MQALASIQVDVSAVEVGSQLTIKFLGKPVFIRRRTAGGDRRRARGRRCRDLPDQLARNANLPADAPATDAGPRAWTRPASGW